MNAKVWVTQGMNVQVKKIKEKSFLSFSNSEFEDEEEEELLSFVAFSANEYDRLD